jgi:hypothetical protein
MKQDMLNQFLTIAVQNKASDVHLQVGDGRARAGPAILQFRNRASYNPRHCGS